MNEPPLIGWKGKLVKNTDGRTGTIVSEVGGFCYAILTIQVDRGSTETIRLNTHKPDSGATGWLWRCQHLGGGPVFVPLGDHSDGWRTG